MRRAGERKSAFEEAHEVIANLTLVLVVAHMLNRVQFEKHGF